MVDITQGYLPGALGRVIELHGRYYHAHWAFDGYFERRVATEMAEFLERFDPARDGFWLAHEGENVMGSVTLDGAPTQEEGARVRWFITDDAVRGRGVGHRLMETMMAFGRQAGYSRIYLWTFAGLDAARNLYEQHGFTLCREHPDATWGKTVLEQQFEWRLDR